MSASQLAAKRRQRNQVLAGISVLVAGTAGLFHLFRQDLIALKRAEVAYRAGAYAEAADLYDLASVRGANLRDASWRQAHALLEARRWEESLALYQELQKRAPNDVTIRAAIAGLFQSLGRSADALAVYEQDAQNGPLSPEALLSMAGLLQQVGRLDDAASAYRQAIAARPNNAALLKQLSDILSWSGRHADAIAPLQAALAIEPDDRASQIKLARYLSWTGRLEESVAVYRNALRP